MVVLGEKVRCIDLETKKEIPKRTIEIHWSEKSAEKGSYAHFMMKEIMEQKTTIAETINQNETVIKKVADEIKNAFGTYLIGCGTAGKVCLTASYLFSRVAKKHVNAVFGSEFGSHKHFLTKDSLLIAVSQSGETADTLEAMEIAKEKGCKLITIVNVESSTMARMADIVIPIKVGPEKAVASTKATTAQLTVLTQIAYALAGKLNEGKQLLIAAASQINDMLNPRYEDHIKELAEKIKGVESMYIIGKDVNYPMALEAAIKLQEVSYIHAEGFAGGELKHGPIALITEGTPVIAIVANDETKKDILSNAMEVKARGGYIIGVSPETSEIFDYWIKVPDAGAASPIVNIIPIQILAYHLSVIRQNNPDMPRNLAKSVTVK
ncbi:SIS domain-containing protein [Candidatus Peregrinibacteria bacterium]|nr:SIS domain-containing protein [Candidatus Peregrinibacteria bacterium]